LMKIAPHIIKEMRFILPHHKDLRPIWQLKLGMLLYDMLHSRKYIKSSSYIKLSSHESRKTLKKKFTRGFEYSDCTVDDSRLTVLNAVDASKLGATIKTRTTVKKIEQKNDIWHIETFDSINNQNVKIRAKVVINATGPWIDSFLKNSTCQPKTDNVRLVKGSHIIVNKLYDHGYSYIFQNGDGRVIFAIPYENNYTLIGTTDIDFAGEPNNARPTISEIDYLCNSVGIYFKKNITADQVIKQFSGVRPLYDNGETKAQNITRDYVLKVESKKSKSALINIFGGKLTTYRRLSEKIMDNIESILERKKPAWTHNTPLPGGESMQIGHDNLINTLTTEHNYLETDHINRLSKSYGTRAFEILKEVTSISDLGEHFGSNLYQKEVDYLMKEEFALYPEDILERRTKLGLCLEVDKIDNLEKYMQKKRQVINQCQK